ncbi:MAG: hypothetical protein WB780_07460 [Candidatus Acidiferrales bacterium]
MTILLGYELGTGEAVTIPRDHMAVTGRTQESGKSTTIEALVTRSNAPALAFVTKRGEKSFRTGRMIPPYYQDTIDPDSIAALLSSAVGEKMQGKLGEIIWLCEGHRGGRGKNTYSWPGAKSLADVLRNCETALEKATDRESQRLYTVLRHYLRGVVKQVSTLPKSARIDLERGLNVMDLREFEAGTQSLIIHDSVMWVAEKARGVTTIVPEAWKFVGQGKRSPVLAACEELIRQGGTLGNYLWLDSQDLVLNTNILRSVGVYLLGVQRERNEVKRVLDYIPDAFPRLKPSNIQTLDVGQFWTCFKRKTILTYVMPQWGEEVYSKSVALGMATAPESPKGKVVGDRGQVRGPESEPVPSNLSPVTYSQPEDEMYKEKWEEAEAKISRLEVEIERLRGIVAHLTHDTSETQVLALPATPHTIARIVPSHAAENGQLSDALWSAILHRLSTDPQTIALVAERPSIDVQISRPTITMDGKTLPGRLAKLLAEKYFDAPRIQADIYKELTRIGPDVNRGNLYQQLKKIKELGFLTEEADGFRAVEGMKVRISES